MNRIERYAQYEKLAKEPINDKNLSERTEQIFQRLNDWMESLSWVGEIPAQFPDGFYAAFKNQASGIRLTIKDLLIWGDLFLICNSARDIVQDCSKYATGCYFVSRDVYRIETTDGKLVEFQRCLYKQNSPRRVEGPDLTSISKRPVTRNDVSRHDGSAIQRFSPEEIIHVKALSLSNFHPYGVSFLEPIPENAIVNAAHNFYCGMLEWNKRKLSTNEVKHD